MEREGSAGPCVWSFCFFLLCTVSSHLSMPPGLKEKLLHLPDTPLHPKKAALIELPQSEQIRIRNVYYHCFLWSDV